MHIETVLTLNMVPLNFYRLVLASVRGTAPDHTSPFSYENAYFLLHFRLLSALRGLKMLMKTEAFENSFKSGAL